MRRLTALVIIFAFVVAACSGGSVEQLPEGEGNPSGRAAGVLRMSGSDPSTIDPIYCGDTGCAQIVAEIFDGLMVPIMSRFVTPEDNARFCRTDLGDEEICLVPNIAAGWPEKVVNADGTVTYTFTLRDDVFWHFGQDENGDPRRVTAQDFKYSWERAGKPRNASSTFELYLSDIVGATPYNRGQARTISGIEVVDDFTLAVTIDADKPYWLWNMAYTTSFVVDEVQVEASPNWTDNPNGTGPFKLAEHIPGNRMVLTANESYHLGAPYLDRVEINLAGGSTVTKYETGELDVAGIGLADLNRVRNPSDPLNADLVEGRNEIGTSFIGFNTIDPVLQNVELRQALAMAIDKELLVETTLENAVVVASTFTPPGMPDYVPPTEAGLTYDPDTARQLLRDAGYTVEQGANGAWTSNVPELEIAVSGQGADAASWLQAVVEMWRQELGVIVAIDMRGDFLAFQEDLKFGRFQLITSGWVADYPDPQDFIDLKLTCNRDVRNNETRYCNEAVDALVIAARTEQDVAKRMALYREAETLMLQDVPIIPMFHGKNMVLRKSYVEDFFPQPMIMPHLRFVQVR